MREVLRQGRPSVILICLAVAAFAFNTVEMMPLGLLPQISAGLGLSAQQAGTLVAGYATVIAVATLPLVRLTRSLEGRRLVLTILGLLVACTVVFVASSSILLLYGSRFTTAAAHGLLWSLMSPIAVAQFASHLRGRVLAVLSIGSSLAIIGGVPGASFLGGLAGWRTPFLAVAGMGVLAAIGLAWSMRGAAPSQDRDTATTGTEPHPFGFVATLTVVALSVGAVFLTVTYLSVIPVTTGVGPSALALALSCFGLAGFAAAYVAGRTIDRARRLVLLSALGVLLLGFLTLRLGPETEATLLAGATFVGAGAVATPLSCQHLLFDNSPLRLPTALAMSSLAFNVGVAGGGFIGGQILRSGRAGLLAATSAGLALAAAGAALLALGQRRRVAAPLPT
ncbi:MFS transporter [Intrasporangium sp.]|uniref:MFS transporter n=1 Tax=Intrasporangium sp. TaxID=1925024 RepID=UPI00293ADF2A|nr:MFS transporter [Intrasporangium sp.]MDV3222598.1 MFS transporter [Intrasporangium sp.]